MKLEDQVCSLEQAKRLKELGVKQESLFFWNADDKCYGGQSWKLGYKKKWIKHPGNGFPIKTESEFTDDIGDMPAPGTERIKENISAFTVAEMFSMLHKIRNSAIIIPVVENVANYLAQEIINENDKNKD